MTAAIAGCYFFPTFSLLLNKPFCNKSTPGNQQIINIELEYKYFVSCWQRNFVGYCLSCDCGIINPPKQQQQQQQKSKNKTKIFHSKSGRLCYCLAASSIAIVWRTIVWYPWDRGESKEYRQSTISVIFDWALFAAKNTGISVFIGIFLAVNRYAVKFIII